MNLQQLHRDSIQERYAFRGKFLVTTFSLLQNLFCGFCTDGNGTMARNLHLVYSWVVRHRRCASRLLLYFFCKRKTYLLLRRSYHERSKDLRSEEERETMIPPPQKHIKFPPQWHILKHNCAVLLSMVHSKEPLLQSSMLKFSANKTRLSIDVSETVGCNLPYIVYWSKHEVLIKIFWSFPTIWNTSFHCN